MAEQWDKYCQGNSKVGGGGGDSFYQILKLILKNTVNKIVIQGQTNVIEHRNRHIYRQKQYMRKMVLVQQYKRKGCII